MLANDDFARFSQEIGLASLGANEEDLKKLAAIYWFTIEFGMCKQDGVKKAYGASILSSIGELQNCATDKPKFYPLDCFEIGKNHLDYPISSMQPYYFVAESFPDAKDKIISFCEQIQRPFNASFNEDNLKIEIDRKIQTRQENVHESGLSF